MADIPTSWTLYDTHYTLYHSGFLKLDGLYELKSYQPPDILETNWKQMFLNYVFFTNEKC